jgi:L-2-hydroxycarboxylate dehydrogenase (NAD+)
VANDILERVHHSRLRRFTHDVFRKLGVPTDDATISADVLVHSDLLGIDSHGVARLGGHPGYVLGLERGFIKPVARPFVANETESTALVDGDSGLGGFVSTGAMEIAIAKAAKTGVGVVTVTNSHHFGIACHYAMLALPHGMIGISMTNAAPQVVPTYGKNPMLGTNPLSIAVPAGIERPFVLDMATSVGAAGKAEIALRAGRTLPNGWLVDPAGVPTTDPRTLWEGGSLLPLGSFPELASHKGYGLAVAVDVLCGVLSGVGFSNTLDPTRGETGHFFMALRVEAFRPLGPFVMMMENMLRTLKSADPAPGAQRVYVHGEKELDAEIDRLAHGVPLHPEVVQSLSELADRLGVESPFASEG